MMACFCDAGRKPSRNDELSESTKLKGVKILILTIMLVILVTKVQK